MFEPNSQPVISILALRRSWGSRPAAVIGVFVLMVLGVALLYRGTHSSPVHSIPRQEVTYTNPVGRSPHSQDVLVEGPLVTAFLGQDITGYEKVSSAAADHGQDWLVEGPLVTAFLGQDLTPFGKASSASADHSQDWLVEGPLVSALIGE